MSEATATPVAAAAAKPQSLVKQLLEAGVHYGHKASHWNPKMQPYIFGKRNGIHIVDVRETIKGLLLAKRFLTRTVASGKDILFVGTKRQAAPAVQAKAAEISMPYVIERWLGGTLTNFRTIRARLKRLEELEALMGGEAWKTYSKKMASQLTRERKKIDRNLGGIRLLHNLPGAVVVFDVKREVNALREAQKLGIPTICMIDTDSDPDLADIPIPGNDDAMRAIEIIMAELATAITEGKSARAQAALERKDAGAAGGAAGDRGRRGGRSNSGRTMFRAEGAAGEAAEGAGDTAEAPAAAAEAAAPAAPQATA